MTKKAGRTMVYLHGTTTTLDVCKGNDFKVNFKQFYIYQFFKEGELHIQSDQISKKRNPKEVNFLRAHFW